MCFGGSSSPPKPVPTYATRFEYNRPVPPDPTATQQKQAATATANTTGSFGSELGTATPQTNGGY